jgi:hypothetical protein
MSTSERKKAGGWGWGQSEGIASRTARTENIWAEQISTRCTDRGKGGVASDRSGSNQGIVVVDLDMHRERYSTLRIVISHGRVLSNVAAAACEAGRTCEMAEVAGPSATRREMAPPPKNTRRRIGGKRRQSPVAKRLREGRGVRASSQPSDKCLDVITMSRHYSDQGRAHEWKTRPSDSSSIVSSSGCRRARRS